MPANIREMLIGFGKNKQSDLATANTATGIWRLNKLNTSFAGARLNTENDAEELGKGHEFATQVFKTSWEVGGQLEKYTSAEFAAWAMAFGLGKVVKTGTPPNYVYTCTPLDPVTDGIELPSFSYVEQIRPGAGVILDRANIGCVVEGWTLAVASGPGRANSKLTVDFVGTGKYASPSTITLPAATAEKLLSSASLAATINSVDYVTAKSIVSLEATWKNNVREGFYPGSGVQDGAAIQGRKEVGNRALTLKFVARFDASSTEITKLLAGTEGTAVLTLTYDANNDLTLTFQRVRYAAAELGETDGLLTVEVEAQPLYHNTNKLFTAVAKCNIDGIAEAEA